jgi:acyl carrier protein
MKGLNEEYLLKRQTVGVKDNTAQIGVLSTQHMLEQFVSHFGRLSEMSSIEEELPQFVIDNFLFGQVDGELSNDDSFLEKGMIDSTGVLELVSFLEKKYQIKLEDEELIPENLDSINKVSRFITKRLT